MVKKLVRQLLSTQIIKQGYIKCRLVHMPHGSVVQPDILFGNDKDKPFFVPVFFDPNQIGFLPDGDGGFCRFTFVANSKACLRVLFFQQGKLRTHKDGSVIYKCFYEKIDGPVWPSPDGRWRKSNGTLQLFLYHHTNEKGFEGINRSGEIWGSTWNIQGRAQLKNIAYGYFTSVRKIRSEIDLQEIAMSTIGQVGLIKTNDPLDAQFAQQIEIPAEVPDQRDKRLGLWINCTNIAPNHLWMHKPMDRPAYYEIVLPKVFRVGLELGATVLIDQGVACVPDEMRKIFQYVIVGDADTDAGLTAPYHEEETTSLAKIEKLALDDDIIGFWKENANSDHYSGRILEHAELHPPE
ncbi:hypothetical protein V5T82_14565 [Magnetovibrio sp. PR-2]|uniref:hypothetical protein n=1 Tax=Magnetovibrio sp. PR-2 TaxID=3120356 RepID=UPI002FCE1AE5